VAGLWQRLGPGLVAGASDDDPGGIATYTVAGASFGYATLWTAVLTFPLMVAVQLVCARVGLVCGVGLTGALRRHYPRGLLIAICLMLLGANVFNIAADLSGMGDAGAMLTGLPSAVFIVTFAVATVVFTVYSSYATFSKYVKWTTLTLLAYIAAAFVTHPPWREVLAWTFMAPRHWSREYLTTVVAILGTTISPYLFFWQASSEVEAEKALGRTTRAKRRGATRAELRDARDDVTVGMAYSNLVFYFIIVTTASTLYRHGMHDVESTRQAAEVLRPVAGAAAYALFGIGLIGSGLLAIPVLAGSASFAIAELMGWRAGLDEPFRRARRFYLVFAAAVALGIGLDLFRFSPIRMLFLSSIVNGLAAPPLLVIIMLMANNPRVMGKQTNTRALNVLGWTATALMLLAASGMLIAR
jgi:NRAMP (natural resistance-associated macrophage protein)-like metal ion transporter